MTQEVESKPLMNQIETRIIILCMVNYAQTKEHIKAPLHWPLWGEFTVDRWIPRTNGQ